MAITSVELSVTCSDGLVCEQPKMDAARCGPTLRLAGPGQALDAAGHTDWILYVQLERLGQHTVTFQVPKSIQFSNWIIVDPLDAFRRVPETASVLVF